MPVPVGRNSKQARVSLSLCYPLYHATSVNRLSFIFAFLADDQFRPLEKKLLLTLIRHQQKNKRHRQAREIKLFTKSMGVLLWMKTLLESEVTFEIIAQCFKNF